MDTIHEKLLQGEELTDTDINIIKQCSSINNLYKKYQRVKGGLPCMRHEDTCYMCRRHIPYQTIMCDICKKFNDGKRFQQPIHSIENKVALVTGGRIKIGYYTALSLLRNGCNVVITTRFEQDALNRYTTEEDYSTFKHRIHIVRCNFLNGADVKYLTRYIQENFKHIDYLINNAAQTISRPEIFYNHLLPSTPVCDMLTTLQDSILAPFFPKNKFDEHGQQIDLRPYNSWVETIETVPMTELAQVMLVNALVPFQLVQDLLPIFAKEGGYIINVSSMEGQFNRQKTHHHPHTNMAKASLNMMTKTCAKDLRKQHDIIMVSVDTGWNTIEEPLSYHVQSPLDCIDGAARVLDPIYQNLRIGGIFYKNFVRTEW